MTTVALVGPGAIGCVVVGALVGQTEIDLVVGARTPFERLVVTGTPDPIDVPVDVRTEPGDAIAREVVLLATKAHQTESAKPFLDAWCGPDTTVVVLQNGVEHVERIRPFVGESPIVPVVVACPAARSAPGVASLGGRCQLVVPDDEAGRRIAGLFADTYASVIPVDDWTTAAWMKLLTNCCNGAISTLTRKGNAVLRDPEARALTLAMMREVAAVARAEGAAIDDSAVEPFLDTVLERAGTHMSSIVVDRINGLPTEWQVRNEVVVRKARAHGIDVPLVAATTTLVRLGEPD